MIDKAWIRRHVMELMSRLDVMRADGYQNTDEYKLLEEEIQRLVDRLNNSTERS